MIRKEPERKARLLTTSASSDGVRKAGSIIHGKEAEMMVNAGYAEWIYEPALAAIEASETATKPKRTRKRRTTKKADE